MVNKPKGNAISQANVLAEHLLRYWEELVPCLFHCLFDLFRMQPFAAATGQLQSLWHRTPGCASPAEDRAPAVWMLTFPQALLSTPERLFENPEEEAWHFQNVHGETRWQFGRNSRFF